MTANRAQRTLNLQVSGPTGSGKSTLVRLMRDYPDVSATLEPQPTELLRLFDAEPTIYCFELQRAILSRRLDAGDERGSIRGRIKVWDRGPEEDFAIFATMFHTAGYVSREQFAALRELAVRVSTTTGPADAFVLLNANFGVLERRLQVAGAPSRVFGLLREQLRLYEEWFASITLPRVMIDTSSLEAGELGQRAAWILSSLARACAGERSKNSALGLAWTI